MGDYGESTNLVNGCTTGSGSTKEPFEIDFSYPGGTGGHTCSLQLLVGRVYYLGAQIGQMESSDHLWFNQVEWTITKL